MASEKRSIKILLAGAYGIRNSGDDLPLVAMCDELRRQAPDSDFEFSALSRHPDSWEADAYGVTMIQNLEYPSAAEAAGRWFNGMNPGDDPEPFETVKTAIREADLLVLGAGNALLDITIDLLRGPIPLMSVYGFLATLYHTPVMLYGMSVGPLRTEWGRDLTRGLLESASVITVRDRESAELCKSLLTTPRKIYQLPDATLMSVPVGPGRLARVMSEEGLRPAQRPVIALGLRDLAKPCDPAAAARLESVVIGLMNAMQDSVEFLLIPQSTYEWDDDRVLAERLMQQVDSGVRCHMVRKRHHPADLIALYGLASATLAVRLHAAVFSAIAGTSVVAVNYLPKVRGFMETLGCPEQCLGLGEISVAALQGLLSRSLCRSAAEQEALVKQVEELRGQARSYATLALTEGLGLKSSG